MDYGQCDLRKGAVFLGRLLPPVQGAPCHEDFPRYFSLITPALRCTWHSIIGASLFAIAVNSPPGRSAPSHQQLVSENQNIILSYNPSSYDVVIELDNGLSFSEVKLLIPSARLISSGARKYALLKSFGNALSARSYGLSLVDKVPWPLDLLIQSAPVHSSPKPARNVNPYLAQSNTSSLNPGARQSPKAASHANNKNVNQTPGLSPNIALSSINTPSPKPSKPVDIAEPSSYAVVTPTTTSPEQSPEPVASEVAVAQVAAVVGASPSTGSGQADATAAEQKSAEVEAVVAVQQQVPVEQELVASSESAGVAVAAAQEDVESPSESAITSPEQSPEPVASEVAVAQVAAVVGASPSTGSGQADATAAEQKSAEVEAVVAVQQQVPVEQELVASSEDAVNRVIKDQNSVILNVEEQIANTIDLPLVSEKTLPVSISDSSKATIKQSVNAIAMGHDSGELEASISHNDIADLTSFNSSQSLPIASESVSIDPTSSISPGSEKVSASSSAAFESPGFDHIKDLIYVIVDIHDSADLQIAQDLDTTSNSFPLSRHSSLGLRKTILQAGVFNDSRIGRQLLNARLKQLTNAGLHVRQLRGSELLSMQISIDPSTQINENS